MHAYVEERMRMSKRATKDFFRIMLLRTFDGKSRKRKRPQLGQETGHSRTVVPNAAPTAKIATKPP
jgi:hypothetical protein